MLELGRVVFPDEALRLLANNLRLLERIILSNNYFITDAGLDALAAHSTRLRHLNLSSCNKITDLGMIKVACSLRSLQYLNVANCARLSNKSVGAVAQHCTDLQHLVLAHCASVSDSGILSLAEGTAQLRSLDVSGVDRLSDSSVLALARLQPLLEDLSIKNCPKITERAISQLGSMSKVRISMEASQNTLFMRELTAKSRASSRVRVATSDDIDSIIQTRALLKGTSHAFLTPELRSKFDSLSRIYTESGNQESFAPAYLPFTTKISMADLISGRNPNCDPSRLECYLTPQEFVEVFSMTPDEFARLPPWKQRQAKSKLKLF